MKVRKLKHDVASCIEFNLNFCTISNSFALINFDKQEQGVNIRPSPDLVGPQLHRTNTFKGSQREKNIKYVFFGGLLVGITVEGGGGA